MTSADLSPATTVDVVGDWNKRQAFNDWGALFLVGELVAGGFAVFRFDEKDPGHAVVASVPMASPADAVECAKRLTRSAMQ